MSIKQASGSFAKLRLMTVLLVTVMSGAKAVEPPVNEIALNAPVYERNGALLGGIGAGFLELRPDGCFQEWAIFNRGTWAYRRDFWDADKLDRYPINEMNQEALQFFVRAKARDKEPVVRRLSSNGSLMNVYSYNTWLQSVEDIECTPIWPGTILKYKDSTLPVQVTGEFFSPVIPHELRISGTPGFYAVFTIKNTSSEEQEVSLASYLRNPLARGGDAANRSAEARKLRTNVTADKDSAFLTMRTDAGAPFKSILGSLCLSMSGGEPSWIAQDFGDFLIGRTIQLNPWHQRYETAMRNFRFTGKLPNTDEQPCPNMLGGIKVDGGLGPNMHEMPEQIASKKAMLQGMSDDQIAAIIEQAGKIPSLSSILDQAKAVDPDLLVPSKKGRDLVDLLLQTISQYIGGDGKAYNWGDSMLSSSLTLKPGEEKQIKVVFSWYFPNHTSPYDKRNMGHMYNHWFKDAEEVNRFLSQNYDSFSTRIRSFQQALRESNLPAELKIAVSTQLYTLIGTTWWTAEDQMGVWEGFGTIGQNTVDVSYQGSHPIATLFPDFQKNWTRLAMNYQNEQTGRLYHSLPSDLTKGSKNNGYGYVDVNCHFVLELTRDYMWFGDKEYLKTYYPAVVRGLKVFEAMDSDGDGLPDKYTNSNTYDTWELQGTPSYLCSIWIGALRGGVRLAQDMGDIANAEKWQTMLDNALKNFNRKLWNGEYFSLWIDGDLRDEACMVDQLSGEMYTKLMGLGNSVPVDRVQKSLAAIYKYNFSPEQGLFNGVYPPGRQPHMPTYRNVQGEGNWTGIEYAAAAHMFDQGMVDEAINVVKAVNQRYMRSGRFFNHEECGPHYYRPMSIWATFLAATGFKVDNTRGILIIASPLKENPLKAPWVSAFGFGRFIRTADSFEMTCSDGETSFRELHVNVPVKQAVLDGKAVSCKVLQSAEGLTIIKFDQTLTLTPGRVLTLK